MASLRTALVERVDTGRSDTDIALPDREEAIMRPHRTCTGTSENTGQHALPLAPGQQTIWELITSLAEDDPGDSRFTAVDFRRLEGELELPAFRRALGDLTRRHVALRTVFATTGPDPLVRLDPDLPLPLEYVDLSAVPRRERATRLAHLAHDTRFRVFDIVRGPLWSVCLARTGPAEHILMISFFHVISDGWSCNVFVEDLVHAYRARLRRCFPQEPLGVTLSHVIEMQGQLLAESPERDAHWRGHLLPLPQGRVFPPLAPTPHADLTAEARLTFALDDDVADGLRRLAWRTRTTPFVALLAAYVVGLSRRTERDRIVVGTTTLGRDLPSARRVIGQFTNNVYVETLIGATDSFMDVIQSVHATTAAAIRNVAPFKRIARAVNPHFEQCRPWPDNRLFDAWFQSGAPASPDLTYPELRVSQFTPPEVERTPGVAPFTVGDVGPRVREWHLRWAPIVVVDDDRRGGVAVFNGDLYNHDLVAGWITDYRTVVAEMVTDPSRPAVGRLDRLSPRTSPTGGSEPRR